MATNPGLVTESPWQKLGNLKVTMFSGVHMVCTIFHFK